MMNANKLLTYYASYRLEPLGNQIKSGFENTDTGFLICVLDFDKVAQKLGN